MSAVEGIRRTSVELVPEGRRGFAVDSAVITTREEVQYTMRGKPEDIYADLIFTETMEKTVALGLAGAGLGIMALGIKDLAMGIKDRDAKKALVGAGKITTAVLVLGGMEAQLKKSDDTTDAIEAFEIAKKSPRRTASVSTSF